DLPRDPQPKAETSEVSRGNGTLEPLEDPPLLLLVDSDAVIDDTEDGFLAFDEQLDLHGLPLTVLHCVADQVVEHLVDAKPIPSSAHGLFASKDDRAIGFCVRICEARHDLSSDVGQVEKLGLQTKPSCRDPGHVEELVDEPVETQSATCRLVESVT